MFEQNQLPILIKVYVIYKRFYGQYNSAKKSRKSARTIVKKRRQTKQGNLPPEKAMFKAIFQLSFVVKSASV